MSESPLSAFAATLGRPPTDDVAGGDACCAPMPEGGGSIRHCSRRRRLWELDGCAHCPVIGVCLPITALRRLVAKAGVVDIASDDYALHCDAMGACKRRTPVAETLQREFDLRYALPLRQSDRFKTTGDLAAWWQQTSRGCDLPGAVWATITHARCDTDLQHRLLGEVHMLQHRVGSAERVERSRLEATLEELAALRGATAELHERLRRQAADHARRLARQQDDLTGLRAALGSRDMTIAVMRGEIEQARRGVAVSEASEPSTTQKQARRERIAELKRALMHARSELVRTRGRASGEAVSRRPAPPAEADETIEPPLAAATPSAAPSATSSATLSITDRVLDERAVLCVGGRPASVPLYRRIIEQTGGRFIHHDGGDQQNVSRLDVSLAAADLVICQTGCISHDAYWRVKDHCKRTGKPCVFVENPGSTSLKRALAGFHAAETLES